MIVAYKKAIPYLKLRPWADVTLSPGTLTAPTLKCLVDTGADYLQINQADAVAAGISLNAASQTSVSVAGGTVSLLTVSNIKVSIEGSKVLTIDALIDPGNATQPPLAGRQLLLAAFDIGFDVGQWLRT